MNFNLTECYTKENVTNQAIKILEKLIEEEKVFITDYEKDQIVMEVIRNVALEQ